MESILGLIVVLLALSVGMVLAAKALSLPPLIGYLLLGVAFGPHALALAPSTDLTHWLAEIGVVFLMLSIGVEFSIARLRAVRTLVLGLGSAQVVTGLGLIALGLHFLAPSAFSLSWEAALALAAALSMSSTAMIMRLASDRGELETPHGRPVVGVLLFQDLAVVPLLVLVPALAGMAQAEAGSLGETLLWALGKTGLVIALLILLGQRLLRPWLTLVARRKSQELFSLNLLLMTLGLAWITEQLGLSLALGAFMAGMLISETEFRYQVEADIRPYRDVLMGLFFVTVGMRLDLGVVVDNLLFLSVFLVLYLGGKAAAVGLLARLFGVPPGPALKTGLWLASAGEFGFVLLDPSTVGSLIPAGLLQPILAAMVLSMLLAPLLVEWSDGLALRLARSEFLRRSLEIHRIAAQTVSIRHHLIVCGFGRSGQNIAQLLDKEEISYVALDLDPQRTREAAAAGHSVVFGDAARRETLLAAGIHRAACVVITYADRGSALQVIASVRQLAPQLPIIVRGRDDHDIAPLRDAGATEVVPEVLEGSLVLATHALALAGVPLRRVFKQVREVRDSRYGLFRGFIHGSDDDYLERMEDPVIVRSLTVPLGAAAAGSTLERLGLTAMGIDLTSLRRNGRRVPISPEIRLEPHDALVVRGSSSRLAELESALTSARIES